ncbi:PDDEXK nuclease domain-containing protein [Aliarcobacter cryaerophilus]|uniref:PDDEXK nuclease domain-containing protein n=1 Tax=Aliarcobacter cryaerophilus TaxID=28198 RepID=UPI0021B3AC25|nr:PDDEXK nuclease domain-containing protein [Aliarcobacter cryaerophilus]MCT7443690.1 PDDEXK nuclease domain-containing protein [Aliarcobacter cryaerophilus]MCT7478822.1 PDDEXK nuclease domain-containing protein [Aliarcobacter cryaerophilus]
MSELIENKNLLNELKSLIETTKQNVAISVNSSLTLMYWQIGYKINEDILKNSRAEYGKEILQTVSAKLTEEFGQGYSYSSLTRMMKFAQYFTFENIATLSQQLSWSHFKELLPMEDNLKIEFYSQMSALDKWSVRTLRNRIDSMLYERTVLSKKPDELITYEIEKLKEGVVTPNIILKDPYVLDFLELNDRYLEKDLEDAILRDIENFILELGNGFSFIARQKRVQIGEDDFYIDLLFYNRKLKRLIALDLKLGKFKAEYKGQMELYLKYLEKYEKEEDENTPLGIILCSDKNQEQIELLELEKSDIHVAKYLTILPPKEEFEKRLKKAIQNAKEKYQNRG